MDFLNSTFYAICFTLLLFALSYCYFFLDWIWETEKTKRLKTGQQSLIHGVPEKYGFTEYGILEIHPRLPGYYEAWESLGQRLAQLNDTGKVRDAVNSLPLLNVCNLGSDGAFKRAFVLLSSFTVSYMNIHRLFPELGEVKTLPIQIAKPFLEICQRLKVVSPVVIHESHDLWNFEIINPSEPFILDNLKYSIPLLPDLDAHYFHLLVVMIHYHAKDVLTSVLNLPTILLHSDSDKLRSFLASVKECFEKGAGFIGQFYTKVRKEIFFNKYRHLLQGYSVDFDLGSEKKRIEVKGGSAAQSVLLQTIDIVFGINHTPCSKDFYNEMRDLYMTESKQTYLKDVTQFMKEYNLQEKAVECGLRNEYAAAIESVKKFRKCHSRMAKDFIFLGKKGTGGTSFEKFLDSVNEATMRRCI